MSEPAGSPDAPRPADSVASTDETRLGNLRRQVLWAGAVAIAALAASVLWQSTADPTHWGPRIMVIVALAMLAGVTLRVILSIRYTPPATALLFAGGALLLVAQVLTFLLALGLTDPEITVPTAL